MADRGCVQGLTGDQRVYRGCVQGVTRVDSEKTGGGRERQEIFIWTEVFRAIVHVNKPNGSRLHVLIMGAKIALLGKKYLLYIGTLTIEVLF